MHAIEGRPGAAQSPGVYSTAFAVQLLCSAERPEANESRAMIVAGMRFLAQQWRDSQAVLSGSRARSKQSDKKQEVGHTDFELTLKCVAVLDAANAIADIRVRHEEFGPALEEAADALDGAAGKLKGGAVQWQDGGSACMGWPWHFMADDPEWDVVPTAKVALALTHPSMRVTPRHLDSANAVINTLTAFLSSDATVVHKAIVCRSLVMLWRQLGLEPGELPRQFLQDIGHATSRVDDYPWQEVVHYSVPSRSRKVSHYKPWIWICPRVEVAEAALLTDPDNGLRRAAPTAIDLLGNIGRNNGAVRFLSAQPPTLLATLETLRFLRTTASVVASSTARRVLFSSIRLSSLTRRLLHAYWWVPYWILLLARASVRTAETRCCPAELGAGPRSAGSYRKPLLGCLARVARCVSAVSAGCGGPPEAQNHLAHQVPCFYGSTWYPDKPPDIGQVMAYHDIIHGQIDFGYGAEGSLVHDLLGCPEVERLRHIRLLNFDVPVLQELATSRRLGHAIGTCYLTAAFCSRSFIPPDQRKMMIASALLHDIGVPPYGHLVEAALQGIQCGLLP